ncbi:conjugal transfer protein TrbL family protein [Ectobacillus sp. sgz5001026]|uniref:conjugal transfer protein TrbL family protein n=1 Tax=Ectobacillus sp. sgz5001026 TaxID=3242473 RepID=UPI0036D43E05
MFKSPIEYVNELIHGLMSDIANAAFSWLSIYLFAPTDLTRYPYVSEAYHIVLMISVTIGGVFFVFNLIKILVDKVGGYSQRGYQEVIVKTFLGGTVAMLAPFLLKDVFLPINNAIVEIFLNKGIRVETFSKFVTIPGAGATSLLLAGLCMAIIFLLLAIQYVIRTVELLILFIMSPLAAWSLVNEEMNIWSIWWRETIATVFTQSLQIMIIWISFNSMGDANTLQDFVIGFGFMIFCLTGPSFLRRFLYSTGAGRKAANAVGSTGKTIILRYVTTKLMK